MLMKRKNPKNPIYHFGQPPMLLMVVLFYHNPPIINHFKDYSPLKKQAIEENNLDTLEDDVYSELGMK
jgi:hypothetical protein